MNSNLLRFIELASNAGLLEPVQSERQLNSSPISNIDNLVHREMSLSLGEVNKLQIPNNKNENPFIFNLIDTVKIRFFYQ